MTTPTQEALAAVDRLVAEFQAFANDELLIPPVARAAALGHLRDLATIRAALEDLERQLAAEREAREKATYWLRILAHAHDSDNFVPGHFMAAVRAFLSEPAARQEEKG